GRDLVFLKRVKLPFEILYSDVEITSVFGEATDSPAIPQLHGDKLVTGSSVGAGFEQSSSNFLHAHFGAYIGQIRTDGLSSSIHHMAGGALPFPQEELLSGRGVAKGDAFSSRRIQRVQQGCERFELIGRQIKRRHA